MGKKPVVGSMSEWSGVLKDFFRQIGDGSHTLESVKVFNEHRNPFESRPMVSPGLAETTRIKLAKFFGKGIKVDSPPPEFTPENLAKWARFNMKPVFFPGTAINESTRLKDWIKPNAWFYKMIHEGKIVSNSTTLYRGWYLADFTQGVDYTDGSQVFENDPLTPIINQLRTEGKIDKYSNTPSGSRFSITHNEWTEHLLPAVALELGFQPWHVSLERAIEFNAIGNVYDPNRDKFNMWEWFHDVSENYCRLCGGGRENGGLAVVDYYWPSYRFVFLAGRPLVSFVK